MHWRMKQLYMLPCSTTMPDSMFTVLANRPATYPRNSPKASPDQFLPYLTPTRGRNFSCEPTSRRFVDSPKKFRSIEVSFEDFINVRSTRINELLPLRKCRYNQLESRAYDQGEWDSIHLRHTTHRIPISLTGVTRRISLVNRVPELRVDYRTSTGIHFNGAPRTCNFNRQSGKPSFFQNR